MTSNTLYKELAQELSGEFLYDETSRLIYATDASSYRQMPQAVAYPKSVEDIQVLVNFARKNNTSLIPRTAGTSLAGQVVGGGIVVDVSKYFTSILEYNQEENWVSVQPGVVRDELNAFLIPKKGYFGPETSTANRAMMGGMVGNNSCGANSVVFGSTREHLLEIKAVLSDGSIATFKADSLADYREKLASNGTFENSIYGEINTLLADEANRNEIKDNFPDPEIPRRNTGYALDLLMNAEPFDQKAPPFNFCKLIAGSEGTLAFITEIKLKVSPLPKPHLGLICGHFNTIYDSLVATQVALKYDPTAVELMDHYILDSTRNHRLYSQNMFFVEGDPKAVLVIELRGDDDEGIQSRANQLIGELQNQKLGYHFPIVWNKDAGKVWDLRKAGLGLLSNMPGDAKPVPVVEDTAVTVRDLPKYILEFNQIMAKYGLSCVHYAHAGSGELHLRPILDLKTAEGNTMFRTVAEEISVLVKKYRGSLSGEHGDGRLRGEFIPFMIGEKNYELVKRVKEIWDPNNIFNPGKIVDTPSMNTQLRFDPGQFTPEYETMLDFSATQGIVRAAEQCNGSGDCRKTEISGGTMCPSYMATKYEKHTTRARANIFREIAGRENADRPFESEQIKDVFDLCLSCKGCKSECPSNVDIGKLKTEFQYQYQKAKGIKFRTWLIGHYTKVNKLASKIPGLYNAIISFTPFATMIKLISGFAVKRSLPRINKITFEQWFEREKAMGFGVTAPMSKNLEVLLFLDEFTNFNDLEVGKAVVKVLTRLGYQVELTKTGESGRSFLSKGLLDQAKIIANKNVEELKGKVSAKTPLIGIEPSAILSFRDEFLDLADDKEGVKRIAEYTFLFEEFLAAEMDQDKINKELFTSKSLQIKYHGHCHQKSLSSLTPLRKVLGLIPEAQIQLIPSGCCGMAGSFGYEKEHFDVSMKIGELVLFPEVRSLAKNGVVVAPGTSCRHQIKDGTGKISMHPAELLLQSLT